jgi:hypothetical protein
MKRMLCLVLMGLLFGTGGCGLVGILLHKVTPPPTTHAKYLLGVEPTAILVENSRNPGETEIDANQIAALLREDVKKWKSAVLVDDDAVLRLRDRDLSAFRKMSIPEVGSQVGAAQVLYIDLQRISLEFDAGGQMVRGQFEAFVRVIDVRTGVNRWPADAQQGYPVAFETPFTEVTQRLNETDIRRRMHEQAVLQIGRFFRDWVAETDHLR